MVTIKYLTETVENGTLTQKLKDIIQWNLEDEFKNKKGNVNVTKIWIDELVNVTVSYSGIDHPDYTIDLFFPDKRRCE